MKELKSLKELLDTIHKMYASYDDILLLIDMAYEENDVSLAKEIQKEIKIFEKSFEELRIQTLLSGEYDSCNAIFTMHAGAGGTDSCDWAEMMYRMYSRWVERKGFSMRVLDFVPGDITGTKGITFEEDRIAINEGQSLSVSATVTPENATDPILYVSSDDKIATVNADLLSPLAF